MGRNVQEGERPTKWYQFFDFTMLSSRLKMVSMATLHPRLYEWLSAEGMLFCQIIIYYVFIKEEEGDLNVSKFFLSKFSVIHTN